MTKKPSDMLPNTVQELLKQSVEQASPIGGSGNNTVYPFVIAPDAPADMQVLSNYLIRVRSVRGQHPPIKDIMEGTSSLTPPSWAYNRAISQPLLTLGLDDTYLGLNTQLDIVRKVAGSPLTKQDLLAITHMSKADASALLRPLLISFIELEMANETVILPDGIDHTPDPQPSNTLCEHNAIGTPSALHLVDQIPDHTFSSNQLPIDFQLAKEAVLDLFVLCYGSILELNMDAGGEYESFSAMVEDIMNDITEDDITLATQIFRAVDGVDAVPLNAPPHTLLKRLHDIEGHIAGR